MQTESRQNGQGRAKTPLQQKAEVYFARMSARIEESKLCLRSATRPLFGRDESGNPSFVGSSVLLTVGGRHFLVSAAHVFDLLGDGVFLMEGADPTAPLRNHPVCSAAPNGDRRLDWYDVGFVQLTSDEVSDMSDASFINTWHWQANGVRARKSAFFFMGYPHKRQVPDFNELTVKVNPYPFWATESPQAAYDAYDDTLVGRDSHIMVKFNHKQVGDQNRQIKTPPDLRGTSGGGIWRIAGPSEPVRPDKLPLLVGIFTSYDKHRYRALLATRIGVVCELIRRVLPELEQDLPRNIEVTAYRSLL